MTLSGFEVGECLEASNGEEALAQLEGQSVDVILTDINMPKMNGEEFLRRLEMDERLRSVPTLVISTDATKARILQNAFARGGRLHDQAVFTRSIARRTGTSTGRTKCLNNCVAP